MLSNITLFILNCVVIPVLTKLVKVKEGGKGEEKKQIAKNKKIEAFDCM